jgi:hypothetical protein
MVHTFRITVKQGQQARQLTVRADSAEAYKRQLEKLRVSVTDVQHCVEVGR